MGHHLIHILEPGYYLKLKENQLVIEADNKIVDKTPVEDIAALIIANNRTTLSCKLVSSLAEKNIIILLCNDKFRPVSVTVPYFEATNTDLLRLQIKKDENKMEEIWENIIRAKLENQFICLEKIGIQKNPLTGFSKKVEKSNADKMEAYGARKYWKTYFELCEGEEKIRLKQTGEGINGRLDYGYAVIRALILRSLAGHGLIAAIGIKHSSREGTFALADDLMEPLRPFVDFEQYLFTKDGFSEHKEWAKKAAGVLLKKISLNKKTTTLLYAVDLYVESFIASLKNNKIKLFFPTFE